MKNSTQNCHVSSFVGPFVIKADAQAALSHDLQPLNYRPKMQPSASNVFSLRVVFSTAEAPVE